MNDFNDKKIILASKSPRRRELLTALGIAFEVRPVETDEAYPDGLSRAAIAMHIAREKALAAPLMADEEWVIGADTIVCVGDEVLGKPKDEAEAFKMLSSLSGRSHEVITGVAVRSSKNLHSFYESTRVEFQDLTKAQMTYYIREFKPFDKAGAYGIQEWIGNFIERIEGSYQNVIGLPTARLHKELLNIREAE